MLLIIMSCFNFGINKLNRTENIQSNAYACASLLKEYTYSHKSI